MRARGLSEVAQAGSDASLLATRHDARHKVEPHHDGHLHARVRDAFSHLATRASTATGSYGAFFLALGVVLAWLLTGPIFHFSDTWQLVINTATTIVTFLMVFLIQHAQNRDTKVLHLKLNELIAAMDGASNELIDLEEREDSEVTAMGERFEHLAEDLKPAPPGVHASVEQERRIGMKEGQAGAQGAHPPKARKS